MEGLHVYPWLPSNLQEPGEVLRSEPLLLLSVSRVPGMDSVYGVNTVV